MKIFVLLLLVATVLVSVASAKKNATEWQNPSELGYDKPSKQDRTGINVSEEINGTAGEGDATLETVTLEVSIDDDDDGGGGDGASNDGDDDGESSG
ncbi:hypothetical protein quinque_004316 [Culex quinquefasciatus]